MSRILVALVLLCLGWPASGADKVFDFRQEKVGEVPRGFRSTVAGQGVPGDWRLLLDEVPSLLAPLSPNAPGGNKRPVLAQLARDRTDEHFPMLIYGEETFGDFTFTTRFKIVDGATEQMAGVAFRIQDEKNFYYIRASALGNTFYFFKIVDGMRSAPIGNKVEIPRGVWHTMTIECQGTRIRGLLNGREIIPALDDKSFTAGRIGFWTKSDSVSYFTDAAMTYKPRESLAQLLVKDALKNHPRLQDLKIFAPATENGPLSVIASTNQKEVGQAAPKEVGDVLAKRGYFYGKGGGEVMLTLPLRDSNGDKVAAVRMVMKAFPGQTENNAVARAMPVIKGMESRIQTWKDLLQ